MYPLLVACKSQSPFRRAAAASVVDAVRAHSAALVDQAQLVSQELIRIAILWHEMWHEALEEASRQYFGESNVDAMLATLLPLHEMMERAGPTTLKEVAFVQAYGRELAEAHEWCQKYRASRKEAELHQARPGWRGGRAGGRAGGWGRSARHARPHPAPTHPHPSPTRILPGLGPVLPCVQTHQQAAAVIDVAGPAVRRARPGAGPGP